MPEFKDIIYYSISFLGIVITGLFSFLVWKATKKSTQVAQESYNLSQSIINSQKQLKHNVKNEFVRTILLRANDVLVSLEVQRKGLNTAIIAKIPKECGLSEVQLAEYFGLEEREIINKTWDILNNYLDKHWTDKNGQFKGTFSGDELVNVIEAVTEPIEAFNFLINNLEKIRNEEEN